MSQKNGKGYIGRNAARRAKIITPSSSEQGSSKPATSGLFSGIFGSTSERHVGRNEARRNEARKRAENARESASENKRGFFSSLFSIDGPSDCAVYEQSEKEREKGPSMFGVNLLEAGMISAGVRPDEDSPHSQKNFDSVRDDIRKKQEQDKANKKPSSTFSFGGFF